MIKTFEIGGRMRDSLAEKGCIDGLVRLVVSTPLDKGVANRPVKPIASAVESAWFQSLEQALAAFGVQNLVDLISQGQGQRFVARENIVLEGSTGRSEDGSVKLLAFIKRREGWSPEELQRYWRVEHAPLVPRTPQLRRYVQSHLFMEHYEVGEPLCDGTAELWWDDYATYEKSWASPEVQVEQFADSALFLGDGPGIDICTETVVFEPGV